MLNQVYLTGRIANDPEVIELENGKRIINLKLNIQDNINNEECLNNHNILIDCTLENEYSKHIKDLKKGDTLFLKGDLMMSSKQDNKLIINIKNFQCYSNNEKDIDDYELE